MVVELHFRGTRHKPGIKNHLRVGLNFDGSFPENIGSEDYLRRG